MNLLLNYHLNSQLSSCIIIYVIKPPKKLKKLKLKIKKNIEKN